MMTARDDVLLEGAFVAAHTTRHIPVVNPADEREIGEVPDGDAADVDNAVTAARGALRSWSATAPGERAQLLAALADQYEARSAEISGLVTRQNGSPLWWTELANEHLPVAAYRGAARLAANLTEEAELALGGERSLLRREPVGVVGVIVPWNAPQGLLAVRMAPALAAGCTVVVKPSPETSLDAYVLGEMLTAAKFPPGVVNIVTGGRETGAALVSHEGTDKISFTGSVATGRAIAATCGEQLKPVSAELGGKSAAVLLADADLEQFGRSVVSSCLPYSGQVCYAWTRVLVHERRYAEVVELLDTVLRTAPLGDPADPLTLFGPLVSAVQRDRVEAYIEDGQSQGAHLAFGGGRPAGLSKGYYIEPAVFLDVRPEMRIYQEEIFGPVLVVVPFADDQEAVELVNDSSFGLSGAVFSADPERATSIARRMETCKVVVNGAPGAPGANPGGYKNSGLGRAGSIDPVETYQRVKNITQPAA